MTTRTELKIDNLLSYTLKACEDIGVNTLSDVIFTFYSIDEIINSKATLGSLLNNDVPTRNNPNKKSKELKDLLELLHEFEKSDLRIKFVSDNYKRMPPLGMDCIAPLLIQMGEELLKLNEILPQFADIKCEVLNFGDTIRNVSRDIIEINRKIDDKPKHQPQNSNPSSMREPKMSYKAAVKKQTTKPPLSNNNNNNPISHASKTRQQSKIDYYKNQEQMRAPVQFEPHMSNFNINQSTSAPYVLDIGADENLNFQFSPEQEETTLTPKISDDNTSHPNLGPIQSGDNAQPDSVPIQSGENTQPDPGYIQSGENTEPDPGPIQSGENFQPHSGPFRSGENSNQPDLGNFQSGDNTNEPELIENTSDDGWSTVRNGRQRRPRMVGTQNGGSSEFKAGEKSTDIFMTNVGLNVKEFKIKEYFYNNFKIKILKLQRLRTRSYTYKSFKMSVVHSDRDILLNPDNAGKWPEGVRYDKFYSASRSWN